MRLITYDSPSGPSLGVLYPSRAKGDENFAPIPGLSMLALINQGDAGLSLANNALVIGEQKRLDSINLLAPIPEPRRNIFCLGWNYAEHSREAATIRGKPAKKTEKPIFFSKLTTSVNAPFGEISIDPQVSEQVDWEVELGVVIGKSGKNIPREKALDFVFGYTVVNDVTARDIQTAHGGQFFKGKSLDGYCPIGPCIVTKDEINPNKLQLRCLVNGEVKQNGNTSDMIFDIPSIIECLSFGMTLLPGDIIATGTPSGVGFARNPPEYLKPGDIVECEVEGIGIIRNCVTKPSVS